MKHPVYCGSEVVKQICEALGVEYDSFRRIVIDIPFDNVVTVYVEKLIEEERLSVAFPKIDGLRIENSNAEEADG